MSMNRNLLQLFKDALSDAKTKLFYSFQPADLNDNKLHNFNIYLYYLVFLDFMASSIVLFSPKYVMSISIHFVTF